MRGVGGEHRRAGHGRERGRALGVIGMPVREHDLAHPLPRRGHHAADPAQVALVARPGVDDQGRRGPGLGDEPGIGAVQRHRGRVGGEHAPRPRRALAVDGGFRRGTHRG